MGEFHADPDALPLAALVRQAASQIASGDSKAAIRLLSGALPRWPDAPDILYLLGAAKASVGAAAEAEALYRRALAARPNEPHFAVELGKFLRVQGRFAEAIPYFDSALAVAPRDHQLWLHRGNALADLGRKQEALDAFSEAVGLAPQQPECWVNRGAILLGFGRATEALSDYDQALALRPGFPPARTGRCVALLAQRRHEDALAECDAILASAPDDIQAANNRGVALQSLGRCEAAIQALDVLLARVPSYADGWSNRGIALQRAGRREAALSSFDRALALAPARSEIWDHRAVVLRELRRFEEARQNLEKSIALAPLAAAPWRNLALLLCECDDLEGAMAAFLRYASMEQPAPAQSAHKLRHDTERRAYLAALQRREPAVLGGRLAGRVLNAPPAGRAAARAWLTTQPQIAVIDDFLTAEGLRELRALCLEGDIWHRSYANGYLGALPEAGFAGPLLAQVATEMRETYPEIFADHPLRYFWAFKYDQEMSGTAVHADQAAVNVNFWITPDEANLDPESGGLVIWDKAAPSDWDFERFNSDAAGCTSFLEGQGAVKRVIPYRCNRAVIFDSDLFHATDSIRFRGGYENRRINLTFLFGRRIAD